MILHPPFQLHQPPPSSVYSWAPTSACSAFFPLLLFFSFLFRKVRTFYTHTRSPSSKTEIQKPEVKERPTWPRLHSQPTGVLEGWGWPCQKGLSMVVTPPSAVSPPHSGSSIFPLSIHAGVFSFPLERAG